MLEIIAEFGTNNVNPEGNIIPNLEELIKDLADRGTDTVKFQHFKTGGLVGKKSELWEIIEKIEQPIESHVKFKEMCERARVKYLCTPFCTESLNELLDIGVREIKIASCDCGNLQMMDDIYQNKDRIDRVILSTGMSTMNEVSLSLDVLLPSNIEIALLHCVSSYPTEEASASLNAIKILKENYGHLVTIGYSDHTLGIEAAKIARALGCEIFEKHVTYDNKAKGFDHPYSFLIDKFDEYIEAIEWVDALMGEPKKKIHDDESTPRDLMKRGIWFDKDLRAGHTVEKDDIILRRPLKGSIDSTHYRTVLGGKLKQDIKEGDPVRLEDLSG